MIDALINIAIIAGLMIAGGIITLLVIGAIILLRLE